MLQQMADAYRDHLQRRVKERRPAMTVADHKGVQDGRVLLASTAQALHLVDQPGIRARCDWRSRAALWGDRRGGRSFSPNGVPCPFPLRDHAHARSLE